MWVLKLKTMTGVFTILFALYAGWQSIAIAQAGVLHKIPQLEGDGGGALLFAAACAIAGIVTLVRPVFAIPIYALSVLTGLLVGVFYQDFMLWFWSAAACLFGVLCFVSVHRAPRQRLEPSRDKMAVRT